MCNITDLQSSYDRQLPDIGGILEESVGHDRNGIKLITKVMANWEHYIITGHGISEKHYGREQMKLAVTGEGNKFSEDMCRDTSCLIIRKLEKEGLGIVI